MADVAKRAGVSVTTVSFVVNDRPDTGLRPETKARVRAAVEELNYRPNQQARSLALRTTRTIGYIGEGLATPYAKRIISGAHDVARANSSALLILDAEGPTEFTEAVTDLLARQVDAIVIGTEGTQAITLPADLLRVQTVLVNCFTRGGRHPSLLPDEEVGGRSAARLLLDAGHRDVVLIAGDPGSWATKRRVKGFRAEFAAAGIPPRLVPVHYGDYHSDSGYDLTLRVMTGRRAPTGISYGNDRMALGGYFALAELGLRIPQDVSVVGYDDQEELADSVRPGLTTIRLPFHDMGRIAAEQIFRQAVRTLPKQTLIDCPPVVRASVAAR